jgi:hypothetical protein
LVISALGSGPKGGRLPRLKPKIDDLDLAGALPETPIGKGRDWEEWLQTHRVELNAMTTPQFIEWLDRKMAEHGDGKLKFRFGPTWRDTKFLPRKGSALAPASNDQLNLSQPSRNAATAVSVLVGDNAG